MEELALGAQPLHHVDALAAEEAHVAAADVDGKLFPEGALWEHQTPSVIFFFLFPFYANATQATSEDETSTHRDVWSENPGAHESRRQTATNELAQRYCYNHTTVSQYNQLDFVVKELRKTTTLMAPQTAVTHTSQLQGSGLKLG